MVIFRAHAWFVAAVCLLSTPDANTATVVGIVSDGPQVRQLIPIEAIEAEIAVLTGDEFDVRLPAVKRRDGGWTRDGIRVALQQLLEDRDVDIVVCLGLLSCNEVASLPNLPKPVIAPVVVDPKLQGFPLRGAASGKPNFVYITNFNTVDDDLQVFQKAVGFEQLAILADSTSMEAMGRFRDRKREQLAADLGVQITVVPVRDTLDGVIAEIPSGIDAVYVTPLPRFDAENLRQLAGTLIERKLPSFSLLGVTEVAQGLLMANGGRQQDMLRLARRIALNIHSILLGNRPEDIPVALQQTRRLAINMRTAEAIGYFPRYAIVSDAELLFAEELEAGIPLGLVEAMKDAVEANLSLQAAGFDPLLAEEDVRLSRSELLPQVQVGAGWTQIDEDRANPLFQSEKSTDVGLTGQQLIYSDDVWAGYRISQYLKSATDENYRAAVLDTLQASGRTYLDLLRAIARERIQRSNLELTRTNLGLARVRQSIGFSGRADVLRWESQIALDRRNSIDAEASRRQAANRLNQVLHRPPAERIEPLDASVESSLAIFMQPRFLALIDNAQVWATFQEFVVQQGLQRAPELGQVDQLILAGARQLTAAGRRYWLPEFTVQASGSENLNRSGAGSNIAPLGLDDTAWSVSVFASLPVLSGGALRADLNRSRYSLRQLEDRRAAVAEDVETRIRVTMEEASSTYIAIELTAAAAAASAENLGIVTDLYSQGSVSVTDLIDAQNAALSADLSAAEAKYNYLLAVIDVLRTAGDFSLLLDPRFANEWFADIEAFFRAEGVPLAY